MTWRYIAQRISGPSAGLFLDYNLPLREVLITNAIGPDWLSATISPESAVVTAEDGLPLLDKWSTAIWAEENGVIRGGGIVVSNQFEAGTRSIECMGYSGYPVGLPYTSEHTWALVDPMYIVRHLWTQAQSYNNSDLGVVVDVVESPVRMGTAEEPYALRWFDYPDIGDEIKRLATDTPFEYREQHTWNGDVIDHRIVLGYPRLGRRRHDLRFVLGENLHTSPSIDDDGERFANVVFGVGAGEGRAIVHSESGVADHRLRRVQIVTDKAVTTLGRLRSMCNVELAARSGTLSISEVQVTDHPNAHLGSWQQGDEIMVKVDLGWINTELWCRVLATKINPEQANMATLTLERV